VYMLHPDNRSRFKDITRCVWGAVARSAPLLGFGKRKLTNRQKGIRIGQL
jgi:hypothetical protein